jgi:hypothetical protein
VSPYNGFSGTILTGLCGAALIGGAVFCVARRRDDLCQDPERVEGALRGAFGANDRTATLHKSDRLPPPGESTASRNVVQVSTVTRVGQPRRDAGAPVRPHLRQSVDDDERSQLKIPPFNAQRMLTDVGTTTQAASEDPNNPRPSNPTPRFPS